MKYIEVTYSCPLCEIKERKVKVVEREAGQDIGDWMEYVCIVALSDNHSKTSPFCHPKELKNIMIPVFAEQPVGESKSTRH